MARKKRDDWSRLEGEYYLEFKESIRSSATLATYRQNLVSFLRDIDSTIDDFVNLAKKEPEKCQAVIQDFIFRQKMRYNEKEISGVQVGNYIKPIQLLFKIQDINGINWWKLNRFLPYSRKISNDRIPLIEDIRKVVSYGDQRLKFMVASMVSGGFRVGAWENMEVGDITPIVKNGEVVSAKVVIYRGEHEEYFTFITPEAYEMFQEYLDIRRKASEHILDSSPALRKAMLITKISSNLDKVESERPKDVRLKLTAIRTIMLRAWRKAGYRWEGGSKGKRYDFKMFHGFRKYFKTKAEDVMKSLNVETLMGHSTGVTDSYYRPSEQDLLEDYLKAVPLLTIAEAEEVKQSIGAELKEERELRHELSTELKVLKEMFMSWKAERPT